MPGLSMSLALSSTAFANGGAIPRLYTCEGSDVSPPLSWTGVPPAARSLVLIIDDPDAPDPTAPRRTWVHWLVYNIPATAGGIGEDCRRHGLPAGAVMGRNDWMRTDYGGPCPPIGRHRYLHKLYALDCVLNVLSRPGKAQLLAAMRGHVLAEAQLIGTYEKH
jgi:Raf kinase inhibitor-like YbhB/YbcL family protein